MSIKHFIQKIQNHFPDEEIEVLEYSNMKAPATIKCHSCGHTEELQRAENFLRRKSICKWCSETAEWQRQKEQFIEWLRRHPEFELIDDLSTIHKSQDKVRCRCTKCNRIQTNKKIYDYYNNKQCYCTSQGTKKPIDLVDQDYAGICIFIEPYISAQTPVLIKSATCQHEFRVAPAHMLQNKFYCPICNRSTGEKAIELYLNLHEINYCREYKIQICNKKYRIDFYLPDYNLFIEYNGIQHYTPVAHFGGEERFIQQQDRDVTIKQYCYDNNIKLIVIPYWEYDSINMLLSESIKLKEEGKF